MIRSAMVAAGLLSAFSALAVPEGPEPNTAEWFEREARNYARTLEAPLEQVTTPGFLTVWQGTSTLNIASLLARNLEDPSWLIAGITPVETLLTLPLSPALLQALVDDLLSDPQELITPNLNTPLTPLCTSWSQPCSGDPTRYPHVPGPNGATFYAEEADVAPVVLYDAGCARISGRVWAPRGANGRLPGVVIENGSIQAPEPLYWWFAQAMVRAGYVVLTFDPRGQGRSDLQTPNFEQGSNFNSAVFFEGLVDAVDFFRSTPGQPYGHNLSCAGTYPTDVAPHNPFHARIDAERLGLAGHSLGASGVSTVAGYPGDRFQFPDRQGGNPVDVIVAWDSLRADPDFPPRVPAMGQTSEYGIGGTPFLTPPDPDGHLSAFRAYQAAGVPVSQFTIQGSTHFDWSLIPVFPSSSWCADLSSGSCAGGWGQPMAEHYSVAWMDRWLKKAGEPGHADADARLLADRDWCDRYSFHFRSARDFPLRRGGRALEEDVRAQCLNAPSRGLPALVDGGGGGAWAVPTLWMLLLLAAFRAASGSGSRPARR